MPTPHQRSANCPHPIFTEVLHTYHPFPLNLIHILAVLTILLSKNLNFIGYNEKFEISVDILLKSPSAPHPSDPVENPRGGGHTRKSVPLEIYP